MTELGRTIGGIIKTGIAVGVISFIGTCIYRENLPYNAVEPQGRVALEQRLGRAYGEDFVVPTQYSISYLPIFQVFRDHDGWRVYSTKASGQVEERKFREVDYAGTCTPQPLPLIPEMEKLAGLKNAKTHVTAFRDAEGQPYCTVVDYWYNFAQVFGTSISNSQYVEIHLQRDGKIGAGNETWGGKYKTTEQMKDVSDTGK
jgi:hypothetical protein